MYFGIDLDQPPSILVGMTAPYFFGYGSLVNRQTHSYPDAQPAKLRGWRRAWRHTVGRERPYLTAEPDPKTEIEGLIAHVPNADWAALDAREHGYDRVPVDHAVDHGAHQTVQIATYSVPRERHLTPAEKHPIYLSYLDVVVQGYLREFGERGAIAFFDTTDGWDTPIRDDRLSPVYPRHQKLTGDESVFVTDQLARIGSRFID